MSTDRTGTRRDAIKRNEAAKGEGAGVLTDADVRLIHGTLADPDAGGSVLPMAMERCVEAIVARHVAEVEAERDEWKAAAGGARKWAVGELAAADARVEAAEQREADLRAVLDRYFDFTLDSGDYDATPEPEDVWRLHRDLRALLDGSDR